MESAKDLGILEEILIDIFLSFTAEHTENTEASEKTSMD